MISAIITKTVGKRIKIPPYPNKNELVLSNSNKESTKDIEKTGIANSEKFVLDLKNGIAKQNKNIEITKKIIPPQADNANDKNNPAPASFKKEILPLSFFIPETKRQTAIKPRNNPSGSDLNQPTKPREKIGTDTANINDANKPAVVPPKTLTNAKTAIEVIAPMNVGNNMVKS